MSIDRVEQAHRQPEAEYYKLTQTPEDRGEVPTGQNRENPPIKNDSLLKRAARSRVGRGVAVATLLSVGIAGIGEILNGDSQALASTSTNRIETTHKKEALTVQEFLAGREITETEWMNLPIAIKRFTLTDSGDIYALWAKYNLPSGSISNEHLVKSFPQSPFQPGSLELPGPSISLSKVPDGVLIGKEGNISPPNKLIKVADNSNQLTEKTLRDGSLREQITIPGTSLVLVNNWDRGTKDNLNLVDAQTMDIYSLTLNLPDGATSSNGLTLSYVTPDKTKAKFYIGGYDPLNGFGILGIEVDLLQKNISSAVHLFPKLGAVSQIQSILDNQGQESKLNLYRPIAQRVTITDQKTSAVLMNYREETILDGLNIPDRYPVNGNFVLSYMHQERNIVSIVGSYTGTDSNWNNKNILVTYDADKDPTEDKSTVSYRTLPSSNPNFVTELGYDNIYPTDYKVVKSWNNILGYMLAYYPGAFIFVESDIFGKVNPNSVIHYVGKDLHPDKLLPATNTPTPSATSTPPETVTPTNTPTTARTALNRVFLPLINKFNKPGW